VSQFLSRFNMVLFGLLVVFVQFVHTKAGADESEQQLQKFIHSQWYQDFLAHTFSSIPEAVFKRCPTLVSNGSKVVVAKPASFGSSGFPNAGTWKQMFPVSGCGNDTILNFYFSAGADEKINTVFGFPGTTRGDITLQRDAFRYAQIGASSAVKDCKTFVVRNTRFEAFGLPRSPASDPGPDRPQRPWWETWSLLGCGHTLDVPVYFMPNATGVTISQPLGDVTVR
jgi:hypothetical protein